LWACYCLPGVLSESIRVYIHVKEVSDSFQGARASLLIATPVGGKVWCWLLIIISTTVTLATILQSKILRTVAFRRGISNSVAEARARSSPNRNMCKIEVDHEPSENLIKFFVKHDLLAVSHQNQAAISCIFTGMPESWIDWCKQGSNSWRDIVRLYQSEALDPDRKVCSLYIRVGSSLTGPR
jgi:hypothetical protein